MRQNSTAIRRMHIEVDRELKELDAELNKEGFVLVKRGEAVFLVPRIKRDRPGTISTEDIGGMSVCTVNRDDMAYTKLKHFIAGYRQGMKGRRAILS